MNHMAHRLILFGLMVACGSVYGQLPAFPGAQGYGRFSIGGRGGMVIEVTNLNDSGPGSLRQAIATPGPRTVVIRTGGVIELTEEIQITQPHLTIAAQTAPGDGVVLKNFGISIFTHDVIVRGLRIRPAEGLHTQSPDNRDGVAIQEGSNNVIFDHCSFSWATDENFSLWGPDVQNITVQWCHISEALYRGIHPKGPHSMGLLCGNGASKFSAHHNLLAHNYGRNPLFIEGFDLEFVANTVFDWGYASEFQKGTTSIKADVRNNRWKPLSGPFDLDELPISIDFDASTANGSLLHIEGNFWSGGAFLTPAQIASFGTNGVVFPASSVLGQPSSVQSSSFADAQLEVLQWAGAIHPQPDATDVRVRGQVADSIGTIIDCVGANTIELDNGTALYSSSNSITYSVLNDAIKYSPEGRRIEIIAGAGAGQGRMVVGVNPVDLQNQIFEAVVDQPWATLPDNTSQFRVMALCSNNLGGYPNYAVGTPYPDADHDGMADDWEVAHGLDPNNPDDRNGLGLSNEAYTNLEVYLNGYYANSPPNFIEEHDKKPYLNAIPNPFDNRVIITRTKSEGISNVIVRDFSGRVVHTERMDGTAWQWAGTDFNGAPLSNGYYLIEWGTLRCRVALMR